MANNIHSINKTAVPRLKSGWRRIVPTVFTIALVPLAASLLTLFIFQAYEVKGISMQAALQDHDRLIIWKVPRTISGITHHPFIPQRYDVIVFTSRALNQQLVKRVIGLPGERIVISHGKVKVYNNEHPEGFMPDANQEYANNLPDTPGDVDIVVPENEIFVLGDNRNNSTDSSEFGPIPAEDIIGTYILRIFPLEGKRNF